MKFRRVSLCLLGLPAISRLRPRCRHRDRVHCAGDAVHSGKKTAQSLQSVSPPTWPSKRVPASFVGRAGTPFRFPRAPGPTIVFMWRSLVSRVLGVAGPPAGDPPLPQAAGNSSIISMRVLHQTHEVANPLILKVNTKALISLSYFSTNGQGYVYAKKTHHRPPERDWEASGPRSRIGSAIAPSEGASRHGKSVEWGAAARVGSVGCASADCSSFHWRPYDHAPLRKATPYPPWVPIIRV